MKKTIYKILAKGLILLAVLVVLEMVYRHTLYPRDLEEHCGLMELSVKPVQEDADMIYLGESSNHNCHEADTDRRAICQMIDDQLPGHHVADLAHNATHAGVFYDIMNNVPRSSRVQTAIVTVNMRSFTSEWIWSNLETPLRKQQVMMKRAPALYRRLLLAFKAYPHWSESEREALVRKGLERQTFTLSEPFPCHNAAEWDRERCLQGIAEGLSDDSIALACHYIKCFACTVDEDNPRIRDFDRIVRLCQRRGWKPVFHILADNEDQIDSLVGPELLTLLHNNARFVQQRYEGMGVKVVNNQGIVRDTAFNERLYPTEHYNQKGRRAVADAIAAALREAGD